MRIWFGVTGKTLKLGARVSEEEPWINTVTHRALRLWRLWYGVSGSCARAARRWETVRRPTVVAVYQPVQK
jgi:hypothetical protein